MTETKADEHAARRAPHVTESLRALAKTLRELRVQRGFRLADLAAATGLSEVHLYRLEQGERTPSVPALLTLAAVYGIEPQVLLSRTKRPRHMSKHRGEAVWEGPESSGSGTMVTNDTSVKYDTASRLADTSPSNGDGLAGSPEQLIGSALAGCFSMYLADRLGSAGFKPQRIETIAEVMLAVDPNEVAINGIHLSCEATVTGIDDARFAEIAQLTKRTCVVSRALMAVPVTLDAHLASAPAVKRGRRRARGTSPTTNEGGLDGNQDSAKR